jgi:predicted DNA-binding protein
VKDKKITIRVEPEVKEKLDKLCEENGISVSQLLRGLIEKLIK